MGWVGRRRFLVAVGAALASPTVVAQRAARTHRIAWLSTADRNGGQIFLAAFLDGMAALGYRTGQNLEVDARWGEFSSERLEGLARDAAALRPEVIVTQGPAVRAASKIPGTIPVVFGTSGDPVELGVAKSFARPGRHFTGVTFLAYALSSKRVELLHEVVPKARRISVISNPEHAGDSKEFQTTREAAERLSLAASHHPATSEADLAKALAGIAAARPEAVLIHPDSLFVRQRASLGRFFMEHRLPAISGWASIAEGGTLLTYGPILIESYRRLAYFVDRVLRGTNPSDLPIEQPSKFELVVNMKTAGAIGIAMPQSILVRADRLIE